MNRVPMLVPVAVDGARHYVYAALQTEIEAHGAEAMYSRTLCGLACGAARLAPALRSAARKLPECAGCLTKDRARYPDGFNQRILR